MFLLYSTLKVVRTRVKACSYYTQRESGQNKSKGVFLLYSTLKVVRTRVKACSYILNFESGQNKSKGVSYILKDRQ